MPTAPDSARPGPADAQTPTAGLADQGDEVERFTASPAWRRVVSNTEGDIMAALRQAPTLEERESLHAELRVLDRLTQRLQHAIDHGRVVRRKIEHEQRTAEATKRRGQ